MVNDYELKMEILRRNQEELAAKRQAIERKIALREATAAELSAVTLESKKQKWKSLRNAAIAAKARNEEFIQYIHETQKKLQAAHVRQTHRISPSHAILEQEKRRYLAKVEELYPAWQERVQAMRLQKLKQLEQKKRAIEKRRYLAKKTFQQEQSLDELIRRTGHEIELYENLEKNEALERDFIRQQAMKQASQLDATIRKHAHDAREYLADHATQEFDTNQEVDEQTNDRIFETFSPRHAISAMRQTSSTSLSYPERNLAPTTKQVAQSTKSYHYDVPLEPQASEATTNVAAIRPIDRPSMEPPSTPVASNPQTMTPAPFVPPVPVQQPVVCEVPNRVVPSPAIVNQHTAVQPSQWTSKVSEQVSDRSEIDTRPTTIMQQPPSPSSLSENSSPTITASHPLIHTFASSASDATSPPELPASTDLHTDTRLPAQPATSTAITPALVDNSSGWDLATPSPTDLYEATNPATVPRPNELPLVSNIDVLNLATASQPSMLSQPIRSYLEPEIQFPVPTPSSSNHLDTAATTSHVANDAAPDPTPASLQQPITTTEVKHDDEDHNPPNLEKQSPDAKEPESTVIHASLDKSIDALSDSVMILDKPSPDKLAVLNSSVGAMEPVDLTLNLIQSFDSTKSNFIASSSTHGLDASVTSELEFNATAPADHEEKSKEPSPPKPSPTIQKTTHKPEILQLDSVSSSMDSMFQSPTANKLEQSMDQSPDKTNNMPIQRKARGLSFLSSIDSTDFRASSLESESLRDSPSRNALLDQSVSPEKLPPEEKPSPPIATYEAVESEKHSITEKLSMAERVKVLATLITRVEEGAIDGDQFTGRKDSGSSYESKRELVRMASGGRKAQVGFYGSDVCFEVILDMLQELGPVLFPPKAFEGIMNDQRFRKLHQNSKDKELEIWKLVSNHMRQLVSLKAISSNALIDGVGTALLHHDRANQRSQRKLREFLTSICGGTDPSLRKDASVPASPSPRRTAEGSATPSTEAVTASPSKDTTGQSSMQRSESTALLQRAFLQQQSPSKLKGFASAGGAMKKRNSGADDLFKSMSSPPSSLSQKLMRGGKIGDYSEFEDDEGVDLQNLIGSKAAMSSQKQPTSSASGSTASTAKLSTSNLSKAQANAARDDTDFDVDF